MANLSTLQQLREIFLRQYSEDELEELAFDLGIDYGLLPANTKAERARELINLLAREQRLYALMQYGQQSRPEIAWPDVGLSISESFVPKQISRPEIILVRDALIDHFSRSELSDLAFDLGVNLREITLHNSLSEVARNLVDYMNRRAQLDDLVAAIIRQRPNVTFPFLQVISQPIEQLPAETLEVVAEAKLVLVGDGNVGKTSLVNRLVTHSFNAAEQTTRGVAITKWYVGLPGADVSQARLNIWDFGGQGSMHATHPYFFSRRAVYLLVLNVRADDPVNRAEYWLRLISAFGGESPIIIVANKIDQFPAMLDERTLKDKYPNIAEFVRTSCLDGRGLPELEQAITRAVATIDDIGVRTATGFIQLKQALEAMTDPLTPQLHDTVSLDEYEELCERFGIDANQRPGYLRRLNDLGVMLYFDDARLDLNVVLNPAWVTEGIYRIINYEPLAHAGGKLQASQLRTILPKDRYPADKAMYILDMMRKFEICFALDELQTVFLLPDLLSPLQPELPYVVDRDDALKLQFEYPVWQGSILTRLLVRLNHYLFKDAYWRNGALFQSRDGNNYALVIADEADRRLRIWVDGHPATRRSLLNRIREELSEIHGSQRDQVKEWVIIPEGGEVSYQLLVNLEVKGAKTYDILQGDRLVELNVTELLNGVRAEVIPDPYRLKELIIEHLNLSELDDLCFKFGTDLDNVEGNDKDAKARNLVRKFERERRMPELMAVLRDMRKLVTWA